jgi:Mechanosensitive ion channel, beta-domain
MQVHGGPQIDLSAQVAMVKAKTRPWKAIIALVLAIAAAAASGWAHSGFQHFFHGSAVVHQIIAAATAVAFCVFASAATIGLSGKARSVLEPVMGTGHAAVVRYALVLIGAVTTLLVTLVLFGVPIGQLLLGGALTSVFVGIAAQQALSNVFAGMVLLLAHPFRVGDAIRMRAGALSGEIDGTVTEIGITYVRLSTGSGVISVPNSQVLNAVVGPLPPGEYPAPPPPAAPQAWPAPMPVPGSAAGQDAGADPNAGAGQNAGADQDPGAGQGSADGSSAGPVGTADGSGGAHRPGPGGEQ